MAQPLMPKATAVWLIDNTSLTFTQIAEFTGLHELEVQAIADGEVATGMVGMDPLTAGQVTAEEIKRCEGNPSERLQMLERTDMPKPLTRTKGPRYTPVTKRQDKPDGISWLVRNHPELSDAQISRLIGTTKQTINAVRSRTHWNSQNIKPQSPVQLGLCRYQELVDALDVAKKRQEKKAGVAPAGPAEIEEPVGADPLVTEAPDSEGADQTPEWPRDPGDHPAEDG